MTAAFLDRWISELSTICRGRGISLAVERQTPISARLVWHCLNGPMQGVGGITAEIASITPPLAYAHLWQCGETAGVSSPRLQERGGRIVPRVPALATSNALGVLKW